MSKSDKIHNNEKVGSMTLVNKALEELGERNAFKSEKSRQTRLDSICASLLTTDSRKNTIMTSMLEKGIPIKEVYEEYIPDAARLLGRYWVENFLTFAQVTLATSRLQSIARELEPLYIGENLLQALGAEVLIIAPKGEQHTFGAEMVARKFRKLGATPYLSINNTIEEIVGIINKQKFRLIGLSITRQKACDKNSEFLAILNAIRKFKIPIVAGGNLVYSSTKIIKSLNIDLVTNDVAYALNYFNINFSTQKRTLESQPI